MVLAFAHIFSWIISHRRCCWSGPILLADEPAASSSTVGSRTLKWCVSVAEWHSDYAVEMALPFVTLLIGITIGSGVRAVVIAPPWGNVQVNPCASVSWQYLMWIPDGKCYPIFKQGPCPPTHELVFDAEEQVAKCQCPSDRVFWQEDQRCYEPFSTGPCPEDSFLHPGKEISQRSARPEPHRRTLLQVQVWAPKM